MAAASKKKSPSSLPPELVREYQDDCRKGLRACRKALARLRLEGPTGDPAKELRLFGHQTAGSAGTYGFPDAGEAARSLQLLMDSILSGKRELEMPAVMQVKRLLDSIESLLELTGKA
ncbi:MAG: Hpt domain-containing protein [Elusimicrobiota bacterium]